MVAKSVSIVVVNRNCATSKLPFVPELILTNND